MSEDAASIADLADADPADLNVVGLPIDRVRPNPRNPNEINPELLDALEVDIRERGFTQPALCRPIEGDPEHDYEIVDGEHRWVILRKLGANVLPAVVIEEGDDEAAVRMVTMNRFRGQFIPIRLAHLIADLDRRLPDLQKRLGMEDTEYKDNLRLATFTDDLADQLREATEAEAREAPVVVSVVCSKRDAVVVERVLEALTDDKTDRGKALAKICRAHEKSDA